MKYEEKGSKWCKNIDLWSVLSYLSNMCCYVKNKSSFWQQQKSSNVFEVLIPAFTGITNYFLQDRHAELKNHLLYLRLCLTQQNYNYCEEIREGDLSPVQCLLARYRGMILDYTGQSGHCASTAGAHIHYWLQEESAEESGQENSPHKEAFSR